MAKTDKWAKMVEKIYTSPNNVKRIFITRKGVGVDLYCHMTGRNGTHFFLAYPGHVCQGFEQAKAAAMGMTPPTVRVTGTGLNVIETPWVCSNVEEIYFDDSVLCSVDVQNAGMGNLLQVLGPGVGSGRSDIIKALFTRFGLLGSSQQNIDKKFPRLKYVGYINMLYEVYTAWVSAEKQAPRTQSVDKIVEKFTEHPVVASAFQSPTLATHLWTLQRPRLNSDYSIRTGTYVFDRDILDNYFKAYSQQILALARAKAKKDKPAEATSESGKYPKQKPMLETQLDRIYANSGEVTLRNAIAIILSSETQEGRRKAYESMTDEGKKRYGAYMAIGIDKE